MKKAVQYFIGFFVLMFIGFTMIYFLMTEAKLLESMKEAVISSFLTSCDCVY